MKFYSVFSRFFATCFYLGLLPSKITGRHKGGGTLGTLLGLASIGFLPETPFLYSSFLVLFILFSVLVAHKTCLDYGTKDDQRVVIDETAGYFVAAAFLPRNLYVLVSAFFIFRAFDGLKPWPIRVADRSVPGGLGVVLDDVLAGIETNLILRAALFLFSSTFGLTP